MEEQKAFMYVSSWAEHGGVPGLGLYTFDESNGEISFVEEIDHQESFNGSCVDQKKNKLYVNNEVFEFRGAPCISGRIFVYDLDPQTGHATEHTRVVTGCANPAYVELDPTGKYLFEAHHSFGMGMAVHRRTEGGKMETVLIPPEADVQVYALTEDGVPDELVENVNHSAGSGKEEKAPSEGASRKEEAHPHCAVFSPSGNLIAVADKGDGHLYLYTFDYEKRKLILKSRTLTDVPGASPRYVVFHPTKPFLFVNHEASYDGKCYVTAFRYEEDGTVERICVVNILDQSLPVKTGTRLEQQGFVITPDGKYLYSLINAADVIGVIKIDQETGELSVLQNMTIPGVRPRGLAISPSGKFVLSSCLVGGELTSYRVGEDGRLSLAVKGPSQPGASYMTFYVPEKH